MTAHDRPSLSVVIPCFNEAGRLWNTVDEVLTWSRDRSRTIDLLIVDDGSTDDTANLVLQWTAEHSQIRLLRFSTNKGKGAAVRAGMRAATGSRRVFIDADRAVPFVEIDALESALDGGSDIAIGSRVLDPSLVDGRLHRRFLGFFFRLLVRTLLV